MGADSHDVRVWDREQSFGSSTTVTNLHDHQRDSALYVEAMWVRKAWTFTASGRMDWFQNYDGRELQSSASGWVPAATQPPQFDQRVFDPRLGITRKLWNHWAVSGSGFRAFRAPTPNELYRSTQVGNQLTFPNGSLLSERATGWETEAGDGVALGHDPFKLLSDPGEPAHHGGDDQCDILADPAQARKPGPDREPRCGRGL